MSWNKRSGARPSEKVDDIPLVSFANHAGLAMAAEEAVASQLSIGFAPSDQRDVPCCVAVALTTAMRFVGSTPPLAPLFNYFLSRTDPATLDDVEPAHAFRSAMNKGVCAKTLHSVPFDTTSALLAPSDAALTEALGRRLVPKAGKPSYARLPMTVADWKGAIDRSLPVLIAFFMSPEYQDIRAGVRLSHARPTAQGNGHATLVIGYDDAMQEFTVRDSRGSGIGVAGTWQLPYARLSDEFIFESWIVNAVP